MSKSNPGNFSSGYDKRRNTKGRPLSGRVKALQLVDTICKNKKNLKKLKDAMQIEFDTDPMKFFKEIIMPLAPKDVSIDPNMLGFATLGSAQEQVDAMDELTSPDKHSE